LGQTLAWGTIEQNAAQLKEQVEQILAATGSERINIIAHSKGGLDARYLAASLGCASSIASITTLSTPHAGVRTMDALMHLSVLLRIVAVPFNVLLRLWGEERSDFYGVCAQLPSSVMRRFNEENPAAPEVYYQSFTSAVTSPLSDILMSPCNWFAHLFDGDNDGLVSRDSAPYGDFRGVIHSNSRRGISHRDIIDHRRKPLGAAKGDTRCQGDSSRDNLLWNPELPCSDIVDWHRALIEDLKRQGY
jgi:triacylglycerol lipase